MPSSKSSFTFFGFTSASQLDPARQLCNVLFVLITLALSSCASRESPKVQPSPACVHLHGQSTGWGMSSDTAVSSDGTFQVKLYETRTGRVHRSYKGKNSNLLESLVRYADRNRAWKITSQEMKSETARELHRTGKAIGVADASHVYLTLRSGERELKADYYAPETYSEAYPHARALRTFATLVRKIEDGTEPPKASSAPQSQ
jgi:hypothetical protein